MEKKGSAILRSVGSVMVIMVLSRLMSLAANLLTTTHFGAEGYINVYAYATQIPNTIFNCFGTALSTVVVPIYAGLIASGSREKADKFAHSMICIATAFTMLLILIGTAISPLLVKTTAYRSGEMYPFAVKALMIMMPSMLFTGLNYIFQGMLQSLGRYKMPAFVSVPSSLVVICYTLFLADRFDPAGAVTGLLIATLIGLSLQAIILIPPLYSVGYRFVPSFDLKDENIRQSGRMMLPVLIGVSAYQLNMFFNTTLMANFEDLNMLLLNAQNLVLYMVMALVYSVTAVVYPTLSKSAAEGDMASYKKTLSSTLKTLVFLMLPLTVGFIMVRREMLDVLLNYGQITEDNLDSLSGFLAMYAIGIIGISLKEVLDRALYSIKNTKISALCGVLMVAVNVILGLTFINVLPRFGIHGAMGIPLAYSVSALFVTALLTVLLRKKIGAFLPGFATVFIKSAVATSVMAICVFLVQSYMPQMFFGNGVIFRIIRLALPVAAGIISYFATAFILKLTPSTLKEG